MPTPRGVAAQAPGGGPRRAAAGRGALLTLLALLAVHAGPASAVTGTPPGAPSNIFAKWISLTSVRVFFDPASLTTGGTADGYTVSRVPSGPLVTCSASPCTVNGLTPGGTYIFTVTGYNTFGLGPASTMISTGTIILSAPGAPTNVYAALFTPTSARVFFTPAPATTGGIAHTYTVVGNGVSIACAGPPCFVNGLTPGGTYNFAVTGTNLFGTGPASVIYTITAPQSSPGAPTNVQANIAGPDSVRVSFTPATTGGIADYYTVSSNPSGPQAACVASPCTVNGLAGGVPYTFTVTATNGHDTGLASAPSTSVTISASPPGAPTNVYAAVLTPTSARVFFTPAPATTGTIAHTYTVTRNTGGTQATCSESTCTFNNLTPGGTYSFSVTGVNNAYGSGPASAPSTTITIPEFNPPVAPSNIGATLLTPTSVRVSFTPATIGEIANSYTVSSNPSGPQATCYESPCDVIGPAPGVTYTFSVTGINPYGLGPPSASVNTITIPSAAPGAPANVNAVAGYNYVTDFAVMEVYFDPPASDGGKPVTSYIATASPGGAQATCAASPCAFNNLIPGTTYTFTVTATNDMGTGPASAPPSSFVQLVTWPSPVTNVDAVVDYITGQPRVTVSFSPPISNGGSPITGYWAFEVSDNSITSYGCTTSPCVITDGLTNGATYTFSAAAQNAEGDGLFREISTVTLPDVPGAPTTVNATPGDAYVTVAFSPPASDGGRPITGYTATASPGGAQATCTASPCIVTGLTNGVNYTFRVSATNEVGTGAPSSGVTAEAEGDPHFTGFDGTKFFFEGRHGTAFALLSERRLQVNALFGSIGPSYGVNSTIWMTGFGVLYRGGRLSLEVRLDTDPRGLRLYTDAAAKHETKVRVALPDEHFLHIVLNGAHCDDLLYSGRAITDGMPEGTMVYFPPATAVNPGDARDGPVAVVKTPEVELAIMRETEDALHLDLGVKLLGGFEEMQGVLGQTFAWVRDGSGPSHVAGGVLAGATDADFEVGEDLMGSAFPHSLYDPRPQPPAKQPGGARGRRGLLHSHPEAGGGGGAALIAATSGGAAAAPFGLLLAQARTA